MGSWPGLITCLNMFEFETIATYASLCRIYFTPFKCRSGFSFFFRVTCVVFVRAPLTRDQYWRLAGNGSERSGDLGTFSLHALCLVPRFRITLHQVLLIPTKSNMAARKATVLLNFLSCSRQNNKILGVITRHLIVSGSAIFKPSLR